MNAALKSLYPQRGDLPGLNANSKCNWPRRTSNTKVLLALQTFYWSYNFFFILKQNKKKHCIEFTKYIYFYLHLFQKHFWDILEGQLVNKYASKCLLGLRDKLRYFFTGPKPFVGMFIGLVPAVHCKCQAMPTS